MGSAVRCARWGMHAWPLGAVRAHLLRGDNHLKCTCLYLLRAGNYALHVALSSWQNLPHLERRVDAVQQALVSFTGIPIADQIVMCNGARLDPAKALAAYKLPLVRAPPSGPVCHACMRMRMCMRPQVLAPVERAAHTTHVFQPSVSFCGWALHTKGQGPCGQAQLVAARVVGALYGLL